MCYTTISVISIVKLILFGIKYKPIRANWTLWSLNTLEDDINNNQIQSEDNCNKGIDLVLDSLTIS